MAFVACLALLCATVSALKPRTAVFVERDRLIKEHNRRYNAGLETYYLIHNKFSHLTKAELRRFTGEFVEDDRFDVPELGGIVDDLKGRTAPESVDYRNVTSAIRDQDTCGACYAFAAVAAMEVHLRLKKYITEEVSEQEIIDCSSLTHGNNGCLGGNTMRAFRYIRDNGFITKRSYYPYENKVGKCRSQKCHSAGTVEGYELVFGLRSLKEDTMKVVIGLDGPVTVMLSYLPESFYHYDGGIYNDAQCGIIDPNNLINHAVAIVGYGSEEGKSYWIIRNSWGSEWGEDGYMRMALGKDICRLTLKVVLPIVKKQTRHNPINSNDTHFDVREFA